MAEDKPPESTGIKLGDLKKLIQDTIAEVLPKADEKKPEDKPDEKVESSGSIADKVRAEIEKLRAKEKEDEEKSTLTKTVAELAEKTREKVPVERRRVHRLMGWGENAD